MIVILPPNDESHILPKLHKAVIPDETGIQVGIRGFFDTI